MKRFYALILVLLMVLSMAACGETPSTTSTDGGSNDTTETTEATTAATEYVFTEQSIYESDTCSIVITNVNADSASGYTLNVTLSNNLELEEITNIVYIEEVDEDGNVEYIEDVEEVETFGTDLVFVLESASLNGTSVDISFSSQVDASSRSFDQIVFSEDILKDIEGDITEIALTFRVYDAENPSVDLVNTSSTIYPYGNSAVDADTAEG